ncbi:ABC Transporter Permease [Salisediminibacterium beveridgei]|uniref:ABC Transporter Permease n=2 Tax=Salisediminibacterium beveridgei TaxID=632773 RepID=A0A1D7QR17_9BACI|nr:ABC Transporter Permease [Salisediminibacterium beveridgei]
MPSWLKGLGFLAPALVVIAFFVGFGLFQAAQGSVSREEGDAFWVNYQALLAHESFLRSVGISVWVAFSSTFISLVIGIWMTRRLIRVFRFDHWKFVAWLPMIIPHFVAGYLIYIIFAPSGWLSAVFYHIGWIDVMNQFPILVNDPLYIGVILTYVWKEIPFVLLMMLPVYQEMDLRYEDVSRTLGGNSFTVFRTVEFPWVFPVSLETFLILFVFVLGAFEVPALLGVTFPKMLPILAYEWFYQSAWVNRPMAQAMMVLISLFAILTAFFVLRFTARWKSQWASRRGESL